MGADPKIAKASELCEAYRCKGFHCSESTIRACSEVFGLRIPEDVLRCASGFRGGGGGYGDRCGVVEAGIMLISYLYGRLIPEQKIWDYSTLICLLQDRFKEKLGSIYCRDLLPKAKEISGPAQNCSYTYKEGAAVVTELLLEAESLLSAVPESERVK